MSAVNSLDDKKRAKRLEKEGNYKKAAEIYECYANNDPDISMKLGDWYSRGKRKNNSIELGISADKGKAIKYYTQASARPDSYSRIGKLYLDDVDLRNKTLDQASLMNENKGISYCQWGLKNGSTDAYYYLADYFFKKSKIDKGEYKRAFENAYKGSLSGNINCLSILGLLFSIRGFTRDQYGFDTDFEMAAKCFDVFIGEGLFDKRVTKAYARLLRKDVDYRLHPYAKKSLIIAATLKDSEFIKDLAEAYRFGKYGISSDPEFAAKLIEHYHGKNPRDPILTERYITYSLLGLYENPIEYNGIRSLFDKCESCNDDLRLLMGFIAYHGINCDVDLEYSKRMFTESQSSSFSELYLTLIDNRYGTSTIEMLKNNFQENPNNMIRNLCAYHFAMWLMLKDSKEGYDLAWTVLKSVRNRGRYLNLLPVASKMALCKKKVKNIDDYDPWVANPLRKTLWVRDPDAQRIYADYIRKTDPDMAIQYYQKSSRCGNLDSNKKLKEFYETGGLPQSGSPNVMKITYLDRRIEEEKDYDKRIKLINLKNYLESEVEVTLKTLSQQ